MTPPLLEAIKALYSANVPTMLDSGGFSAHFSGVPVDVDDYIAFCKENHNWFTQYVQLDKIKDDPTSRLWLQRQYDAGLKPMPVFTVGANEREFDWFLKFSRRICVAGWAYMGNTTSWGMGNSKNYVQAVKAYEERVHRLWNAAGGSVKLHGLSFTSGIKAWKSKVWSVDSSSWVSGHRYGMIGSFVPEKGITSTNWKKFLEPGFSKKRPDIWSYLMKSGIKLEDFSVKENSRGSPSLLSLMSADAWISYAIASRAHGVTMFLAAANIRDVSIIAIASHARLVGGGFDWKAAQEMSRWVKSIKVDRVDQTYIDFIAAGFRKHLADPLRSKHD
jgi:hypothetical protein